MFRQYLVVSSFVASVPPDKDKDDFILSAMAEELSSVKSGQMKQHLMNTFNVIEGEEVDFEEEEEND